MTDRGQGKRRGRCGKLLYRDEIAAKFALANLQRRDKGETRIYKCNICFGQVWHVTAQPPDPGRSEKRTGSIAPQSIDEESSLAIG